MLVILLTVDQRRAWAFILITALAGGAAFVRYIQLHWRNQRSQAWMHREARLEDAECNQLRERRSTRYRASGTYSYSVDVSIYGGAFQIDLDTEPEAIQLLNDLRNNHFRVRVNPAHPDQSLLVLEER